MHESRFETVLSEMKSDSEFLTCLRHDHGCLSEDWQRVQRRDEGKQLRCLIWASPHTELGSD
jgi:hypothetical protein